MEKDKGKINFDFTPDPKVLLALTHTPMQPIDGLCELIDNGIDSFHAAKLQGITVRDPIISITLPSRKDVERGKGRLIVQDNGPGMDAQTAENAIKAGYSGNNPYDTLGLFGMGFNISTGKFGNITTLYTARENSETFLKTEINLNLLNNTKSYILEVSEINKANGQPFGKSSHGTIIEVKDWWPAGNANHGFIKKLVAYGLPKIKEEIGRRYSTIISDGNVRIYINGEKCEPFEHCVWSDERYVIRNGNPVPAIYRFDQVLGSSRRCTKCTALIPEGANECPSCHCTNTRTIEERIKGWVGIQRFDSETDYGIDLIRNGRAIRKSEQSAFFEYVDEFGQRIKDYPIDSQYGRIVGEVHMDFVPVDFLKVDFQRSSEEWQKAMEFLRGNSSLQPSKPGAENNNSPIYKLFQGYRRVRDFGIKDMYMGYYDPKTGKAKRISRDIEKEYYQKFKAKTPGFYDDEEWWKLVETADQKPVEELPECPNCGAQNLAEAEECSICGYVLKGKNCINPQCNEFIPLSAKSCPHCGHSQEPRMIEPWICKICGTKNLATSESCIHCGKPKGSANPISREELLKDSNKEDNLSRSGLNIKLSDGTDSNRLDVDVYSVKRPMFSFDDSDPIPIILFHETIGKLEIFVDFSHALFKGTLLNKEQFIASEIAMYIFDERKNLMNYKRHNLSNLTYEVLHKYWKDSIELNDAEIQKDVTEFLRDVLERLKFVLGPTAKDYYQLLTEAETRELTNNIISQLGGEGLKSFADCINSGKYFDFVPLTFVKTLYKETPDSFFAGGVWDLALTEGDTSLLSAEVIESAKTKIIAQYENYLLDLINFTENKYTDISILEHVKLSLEFLRRKKVS